MHRRSCRRSKLASSASCRNGSTTLTRASPGIGTSRTCGRSFPVRRFRWTRRRTWQPPRVWVINYWDHLHDSKQAYESMQVMFSQSTFPNLMDTHPPGLFQIDGNLGAANGMLEALVQSRWYADRVEVDLLPALPLQWAEG